MPRDAANHKQSAVWRVMRTDDNGNEFEVTRVRTQEGAAAIADAYERRGHKQLYWIAKLE